MVDQLKKGPEYKFIKPDEYREILAKDLQWYKNEKVGALIDEYFGSDVDKDEPDWKETKREVIRMFADGLANDEILLDKEAHEFWNDDDRPNAEIREMFGLPELKEGEGVNTVVIHHAAGIYTYDELNALHMLRLYVPHFRNGVFKDKRGISSGHKRVGTRKETFVGYHYVIREDGSMEQILDKRCVGFHAGDYPTNCGSYGVCIMDDLTNKRPSSEALTTARNLIRDDLKPNRIIGHREVTRKDGSFVDTTCPGELFLGPDGWKKELV